MKTIRGAWDFDDMVAISFYCNQFLSATIYALKTTLSESHYSCMVTKHKRLIASLGTVLIATAIGFHNFVSLSNSLLWPQKVLIQIAHSRSSNLSQNSFIGIV